MNQGTFFENFEVLADAPNGVQKLRELIFQLAVQGKLVPQDPYDEPAEVLIEKITAEKERLIKEGKIRKPKPLSSNDVINPYKLPLNWKWTRLFDIGLINPRNKAKDGMAASFIPMTLISETYSIPLSSERRLWGEIKSGFTHFAEEDVVLAKITPCFQNGKSAVMRNLLNGLGAGTTELHVFRPLLDESVNPYYVLLYLRSPQFLKEGIERMTGTAGQKRVPRDYFAGNPFPLPPFKEQNRIVAKVDQFMALCDELEARQQKKHEQRILLNNAALDKLFTAPTPGEFAQHWQRICDNFDLLYDAPETVGQLRQAVLQLAVQGKLVPQDEGDEPAAVLLEKATSEKERLIKEGKIRKPKPLSSNEVENPYKLPLNWKWTRLFDIGLINPRNQAKDDMATSFIPMTLISETYSIPISSERRLWGEIKSGFTHFAEEDVVLAKITPCFQNGKSAVMRNLLNGLGAGTTELHVFRPLLDEFVNPDYVLLYLRSPQFLKEGIERMTGTAGQKRVPRDYFAGNPFPLPPFEEQKRIVAKVDQLIALCNELEAGLVQAQTDGGKLMEAVVHHVLAA
jgi:type I restriction enzyme, S subunit